MFSFLFAHRVWGHLLSGALVNVWQSVLGVGRWGGRALVCSLCQFLWCKYSHHSQFQATSMMLTDWQNSWKFNSQLLQVCSSLLRHRTACTSYVYVLQSSLIALGAACLGMLLILFTGARISDTLPHLPQHPSFSFSTFSLFKKLLTFFLYGFSSCMYLQAMGNWNDTFLLHHVTHSVIAEIWAELGTSKMGIKDSTVATGTVQL